MTVHIRKTRKEWKRIAQEAQADAGWQKAYMTLLDAVVDRTRFPLPPPAATLDEIARAVRKAWLPRRGDDSWGELPDVAKDRYRQAAQAVLDLAYPQDPA